MLGALVSTELPAAMSANASRIDYQRYGSGHLHGIALDGNSLIDFERDHLHRESQRTLYGANTANGKTGNTTQLRISRDLDVMGRLLTQQLEALNPAIPAPQLQRSAFDAPLPPEPRVGAGKNGGEPGSIGSIEPEALTRHYRYNALGQLTEVRVAGLPQLAKQLGRTQLGPHSPTLQQASTLHAAQRVLSGSVLQFDYDPLGRLIAATDPLDPEGVLNRYRFDAAGNRLSSHPGSHSPQSPPNHRPESTATSGLQANTSHSHTHPHLPTPTPASKRAAKASARQAALIEAMQRPDFNPLYGDAQNNSINRGGPDSLHSKPRLLSGGWAG